MCWGTLSNGVDMWGKTTHCRNSKSSGGVCLEEGRNHKEASVAVSE